jgi:hypothetical protein
MVDRLGYVPPWRPRRPGTPGKRGGLPTEFPVGNERKATETADRQSLPDRSATTALSPNPQPRTSHDQHRPTSRPLTSPHRLPNHPPFSSNPNSRTRLQPGRLPLLEPVAAGLTERR